MESSIKGWQRVLLIIIPYFFIVGLFQYFGIVISGLDYEAKPQDIGSFQQLIISGFNLLGHFVLLWLFMRKVDNEKIIELGFHFKNRLKDFNLGFVIGLLIMLLGFLILWNFEEIKVFNLNFDLVEFLIAIAVFAIIAIVEESLLRGYVLRNFMLSMNKYVALILSAIIFAFMHSWNPNISWFAIFQLFLAGLLLGASYIYTRNLWFPIALHFSWNFFQSLIGFNVSGKDFYSIVEFNVIGSNLWNGGEFGFEASILSTVAQVLSIILIFFYFRKKSSVDKSSRMSIQENV